MYDTNPISVDMDGDGAWDPIDRDPKRDVMLEISPISASVPTERNLQIVTTFSLDSGEDYGIYSLKKSADSYQSSKYYAYFDGTHGSSIELHYYVDINDCTQTQGNSISFNLQLWHVDRYWGFIKKWDNKLLSADRTYYIQTPGHLTQYTIYDTNYEFKVKVKTIGIEKANTIAIYETNGTVFNGHYQEQEKMNIIQLYVNDSGDGTPFVEGPNAIVIPTSLFTETIFNAYVQNETLDKTPIYSANEEIFKFISVGRDGNTEQASDEVDFVFIRFDISSQDAMEILNLLLTCLENETINETAVTYSYVSTKENNTSAAVMNLPITVLGFIPWYCNFSESPQGSKPKDFEDWFWSSLKEIGKAIIGFIITIVMAIVAIVKLIIDFIIEFLMENLPILVYILWLIIRAIILVLVYIFFVLELLSSILMFLILAISFLLFGIILGIKPIIQINSLEIQYNNYTLHAGYRIVEEFNNFFELDIPTLIFYIGINTTVFEISYNFFKFGINIEFEDFKEILPKQSPSSSFINLMKSDLQTSGVDEKSIYNGISVIFGGFSVLEVVNWLVLMNIENDWIELIVNLATYLTLFGIFCGMLQYFCNSFNETKRKNFVTSLFLASLFLVFINYLMWRSVYNGNDAGNGITKLIKNIYKLITIIGFIISAIEIVTFILGLFGIDIDLSAPSVWISAIAYFISIFIVFRLTSNEKRKPILKNWLYASLIMFGFACFMLITS